MRFVAVYSLKFPLETAALMKYGELIRDLTANHNNNAWSRYDFQFHKQRELSPIPWDQIHTEFWIRVTTTPNMPQPFRQQRRFGGVSYKPVFLHRTAHEFLPNTCWPFNRRGFCNATRCFPHICGYCNGQHTAKSCPTGKHQDPNQPTRNKQIPAKQT